MKPPALLAALAALTIAGTAAAQTPGADPNSKQPFGPPVEDRLIVSHLIVDQLEGRLREGGASLRWDAQAWTGPDEWRLWFKTEGERSPSGELRDGQAEAFFAKPITTFWNLQIGGRYDLDSRPGRGWGALGVQGLAPGWLDVEATAYVGQMGGAAKVKVSNDILLTNHLILQPEAEVNGYTRDDRVRLIASGISDLDAGLRLRYEVSRKFAPYVGVAWEKKFGRTANLVRASGESADDVRFTVGLRTWF